MAKISCLICTYNTNQSQLVQCIDSILKQTFSCFEIIIIDDCSNYDVSYFLKTQFNDPRIKVFRNETNKGISYSRNLAFSKSSGDYIAISDADDISNINRFDVEIKYLIKHKKCMIVSSQLLLNKKNKKIETRFSFPKFDCISEVRLFWDNSKPFPHGPTMFRRSFFIKNNIQYDERYRIASDYSLWVNASHYKPHFHILNKPLYFYRIHEKQASQFSRDNQKFFADRICIDQLLNLNISPTKDDERTHLLLRDSDPAVDLDKLCCWSKRLVLANNKIGYYNKFWFNTEIKYRIFKLQIKAKAGKYDSYNFPVLIKNLNIFIIIRLFAIFFKKSLKRTDTLVVRNE